LQQCSLSYCIAYHFKPLDAAPAGAARGLLEEKLSKTDENWIKLGKTGQNWAKLEKIEFR